MCQQGSLPRHFCLQCQHSPFVITIHIDWKAILLSYIAYIPWTFEWTKFMFKLLTEVLSKDLSRVRTKNLCSFHPFFFSWQIYSSACTVLSCKRFISKAWSISIHAHRSHHLSEEKKNPSVLPGKKCSLPYYPPGEKGTISRGVFHIMRDRKKSLAQKRNFCSYAGD